MAKLDLNNNPLYQSPHTYLQAAGSDQSDGTAKGIDLRWAFNKVLGDNHLPKGNLSGPSGTYPSTLGFNKANDFVKIYRTSFDTKVQINIKFKNNVQPTVEINTGTTREWHYNNIVPVAQFPTNFTNITLRFMDVAQYIAIRATMPTLKPGDFMQQYTGIIEVQADKLMFTYEFKVDYLDGKKPAIDSAYIRTESISLDDTSLPNDLHISCRKKFIGKNGNNPYEITCENIKYFRFDRSNTFVKELMLQTYVDFILSNQIGELGKWDFIGDFSLTTTDSVAYLRLEDPANYVIDKKWPKFNDYDQTSGAFTVKVNNYKDKWLPSVNPTDGLKEAIKTYLTKSETDFKANALLQSQTPGDNAQINISYLDMLKIVGLDFHVARMMGLGFIDNVRGGANQQYVYVLQYVTTEDINLEGSPSTITHTYMTIPTGKKDFRLPPSAVLNPVTYGIAFNNGTGTPTPLTDPNGYSLFSDVRFVNVNRAQFNYEKPFGAFFFDTTEYCLCDESLPVLFGLDYKGDSEANYRKPEISNDPNYTDYAGFPEVVPIPDSANGNPIYIHQEEEEGIHDYALYSINWFSRISALSTQVTTDATDFPVRKTLLPPFNFATQLLQQEDPLIFTTSLEQTMLQNYTATDKTLVRATFDWNHIHFNAYQFADKAEFFFRKDLATEIKGEILSVTQLPNNLVQVATKSYTVTSTNPAEIVQPNIQATDVGKFVGALFSANQKSYVIESVTSPNYSGDNPIFILRQIKQTNSSDPLLNNQFITTETYTSPLAAQRFITSENLADENNWESDLIKRIYLEKFFNNGFINVVNSTGNNKKYALDKVVLNSGNTNIYVKEKIKSNIVNGDVQYERVFRIKTASGSPNSFTIQGNLVSQFTGVTTINISGSQSNDNTYSIIAVTLMSGDTSVEVSQSIPDTVNYYGYLSFEKLVAISALNQTNKIFTVASNITSELIPPHVEYAVESDGSTTRLVTGGIFNKATIVEKPRVYSIDDPGVGNPPFPGDAIQNSRSGVYEITFVNYQLASHIDPEVDWYKGTIRIKEDPAFLPSNAIPQTKVLQVWNIDRTQSNLKLLVIDNSVDTIRVGNQDIPNPAGTYVPILTIGQVDVNFHPSYKTYLKADNNINPILSIPNNFDKTVILPSQGEGNRKTFMAIRSIDTSIVDCESYLSVPVVVLALEIVPPAQPGIPTGPIFATRPDFYGKSTYAFDIQVDTTNGREPFALVFYRANEDKILDTLYKEATVLQIKTDLSALQSPDSDFFNNRWYDLVNGIFDTGSGLFKEYISGGYRFPNPDNDRYIIPDRDTAVIEKPFNGIRKPGDSYTYVNTPSVTRAMIDLIKEALDLNFLPLTEQPLTYKFVNNGRVTSNRKPVFKKPNGELMLPTDSGFDPSPMAVKYVDSGNTFVRFTDYSLDGSSKNIYFYYGLELSNRMKFGERSLIAGPIQLVNTGAAEPPEIKRILSQLQNTTLNIPTAVKFELNSYIPGETIRKLQIYRTSDADDALSMRNMKLVKTVDVGDDVLDDFSDVAFPLYGDPLFYRLIALREIVNEQSMTEFVPSKPSNLVMGTIVDNVNPSAPQISYTSDPPTTTSPITLNNVVLNWPSTCYNGTYYLYKMNNSGNWTKIYQVKSNAPIISIALLNTDLANGSIPKQDADLNTIYARFRVQVENSSGLLNLTQREITI
ncbi:MAG: hypothetical protein NT084_10640 [Bacteroidetes bacterium]|nr:hypothetical protein [Bacteroidota bacterium]